MLAHTKHIKMVSTSMFNNTNIFILFSRRLRPPWSVLPTTMWSGRRTVMRSSRSSSSRTPTCLSLRHKSSTTRRWRLRSMRRMSTMMLGPLLFILVSLCCFSGHLPHVSSTAYDWCTPLDQPLASAPLWVIVDSVDGALGDQLINVFTSKYRWFGTCNQHGTFCLLYRQSREYYKDVMLYFNIVMSARQIYINYCLVL